MSGVETAEAYLSGKVPEGNKCTLLRKLFSHCSYCSCAIGKGPGWLASDRGIRCSKCGWVYCCNHVRNEDGKCQACLDTDKAKDSKKKITLVDSVIVVGTGMGGLATAVALKNRGVSDVTILERAAELRTSGGPIIVQTNAMRALLDIDPMAMERVFDTAGPMNSDGAFKTIDGKVLLAANLSTLKESRWGNPEGRSIVRGYLQQILYDRCLDLGIKVHFGVKVTNIEQTEDKVTITGVKEDETKEILSADLLVAADGIWSKGRQQVLSDAPKPFYQGYQMIVSRAPASDFDQMSIDCWGEAWGNAHRFGFFRCGQGGTALYYSRTCPKELDKDKGQQELKDILIDSVSKNGYDDKIIELAKAAEVSRIYRFPVLYMPPLKHHVSGRVILLGDAANGMPPNLGQGGGMALESASILSQCLLIGESLEQALTKYETRRVGRCSLVAKESKTNGDLFQASNMATVWLRNSLFAYLGKQSNEVGVDELELPDPFAFLFSYRLLSWPHHKE